MALAEQLKTPLLHIGRTAELQSMYVSEGASAGTLSGTGHDWLRDIQHSADMSLHLLDGYLLSLKLNARPDEELSLEPVSVSAVLHDTAQELQHVAARYGVTLNLHVEGRYEPVMAHRQALRCALVSLGYALIEALPAAGVTQARLQLATHRTRQGIVAGLYSDLDGLTPQALRQAQHLHALGGHVRQPFVGSLPGSGAGVFIAEAILAAMQSRLRVGRYQKLPGFAVTLPASEQLQLV